jgi:tRNA(Ser,Leu) C12 N-acetylase TAN1
VVDWNIIVTLKPGAALRHEVLGALARFGRFRRTAFRDVCMGCVEDLDALLEAIRAARAAGKPWAERIARVIPAETVLSFRPETLQDLLKEAVTPLVARMSDGSFCVRLERRGLAGKLPSAELERAVAEHAHALAAAQGKSMRTDFSDPDFIIAAETLGEQCGLALLTRSLRERYAFVQTR